MAWQRSEDQVASSVWDDAIPRIRLFSCGTPVHQHLQPTKGLKKPDRRTARRSEHSLST